ncbi:MAG: AAA family ATPase, partial [Planctomycetes bacterium]|nr:AAA family ATPase [Planctomycetota bacterium]
MAFEIKKAKRQRRPLKINLEGVSGSGKTYTALRLAFAMRRAGIGKKIVVADSENESAGLYEGVVQDGERWEYDVCPMPPEKQNPAGYTEAYEYLVGQGFDVIIGDSLTHAWYGAQEIVDRYAQANKNDKFGGWAKVTPQQRQMLATLTDARAHFIGTMRVKSEYDRVQKEGGGAQIKKVGTKTDQREGAEYEFDCVVRMDKGDVPTDHVIVVD